MEMETRGEYEARWARIEALQEANTRDIAALTATQRDDIGDIAKLFKLTGEIAEGGKVLLIAQQKTEEKMEDLAAAMTALAIKSAETQGKLDALIHMWDDWIRDRGGKNGAPKPNE